MLTGFGQLGHVSGGHSGTSSSFCFLHQQEAAGELRAVSQSLFGREMVGGLSVEAQRAGQLLGDKEEAGPEPGKGRREERGQAVLRIGEVLMANRSNLALPGDSAPGTRFALLRVKYPERRGRAARHQAARKDPPDLVELLAAIFGRFGENQKLWPCSAVTLRKRLHALLKSLGLATERQSGCRPFDLGSFKPGGATYLLLPTEGSEVVRRRGRWVTSKVCELDLQEVMYTTYTEKLAEAPRQKIQQLAGAFPAVLWKAICFLEGAIPPKVWFRLYQTEDREEPGKEREKRDGCPAFAAKGSGAGAGSLGATCRLLIHVYIYTYTFTYVVILVWFIVLTAGGVDQQNWM